MTDNSDTEQCEHCGDDTNGAVYCTWDCFMNDKENAE